jgi:hypothetical protein
MRAQLVRTPFMIRKLVTAWLVVTLMVTTVACGGGNDDRSRSNQPRQSAALTTNNAPNRPIADGKYPVQQASYNDANGEYTVMLLNTPAGTSPTYRSTQLQMARLTEDEVKAGEKAYLKSENGQTSLHLTEDFKIEYVRNVTEERNNPQTGQRETVVIRQESSFWQPFFGSLAGQAVGSLLFRPQYYVPPVYQPGGVLRGYGGYGNSYNSAIDNYRSRYNSPPPAAYNRGRLRTTGRLNNPGTSANRPPSGGFGNDRSRSSGAGFGTNTLRSSGQSRPRVNSGSGFGSSRRSSGSFGRSSGGFGGRRR